ncbi:MAG: aspartyl protease family protein [Deltaproteobacteria bacterium]|nr:aspartyl protease family protein [Deltaproteobacteria bacterium]
MGRIIKEFTAEACNERVEATGKIDNGADRTVLQPELATALGFDRSRAKPLHGRTASGQQMFGHAFRVKLTVDKRTAEVEAFVPAVAISAKGEVEAVDTRNLIGTDFLQGSGASLDYSKPHDQVFSGMPEFEIGGGWIDFDPPTHTPRRGTGPCRKRRR